LCAGALRKIFKSFASFGVRQQQQEMDGVRFSKLSRDCKLIGSHLTQTDIDIIFATVKTKVFGSADSTVPGFSSVKLLSLRGPITIWPGLLHDLNLLYLWMVSVGLIYVAS
jgi:p25-alpha